MVLPTVGWVSSQSRQFLTNMAIGQTQYRPAHSDASQAILCFVKLTVSAVDYVTSNLLC